MRTATVLTTKTKASPARTLARAADPGAAFTTTPPHTLGMGQLGVGQLGVGPSRRGMRQRRHGARALRAVSSLLATGAALLPILAQAQEIDVGTASSSTVTFAGASQTVGPFPFSDLGIDAKANVSPQPMQVTTGGSTAFNPLTSVLGGEQFVPGTTQVDIGYTPGWNGSLSAKVVGSVQSDFTYNIGPFHGSKPILGANVNTGLTGNLTPALQVNGSGQTGASSPTKSASLSTGINLDLGFCPLCIHLASVDFGVTVGAKVQQTVTWSPTATYGDLVWYSTTKSFSPADNPQFVSGTGGTISNTFAPTIPLSNGEKIFMNMLPVVELSMPVTSKATTRVPASFFVSFDVFGDKGSDTFPLGDLWDLSTPIEKATISGKFDASSFYSVPIDVAVDCSGLACVDTFQTPAVGGGLGTGTGGPASDPPKDTTADGGPDGGVTGPGTGPTNPLFPNGACSPTDPTECGTGVSFVPTSVPEPDSLPLLVTGVVLIGTLRLRSRDGSRR